MIFHFWGRGRPVASDQATAAVEEAVAMRVKQDEHARRFEDHLQSNGFAEMVETIFVLAAKNKKQ